MEGEFPGKNNDNSVAMGVGDLRCGGRKARRDGIGDTSGGTMGIVEGGIGGFSSWDESPQRGGGDCGALSFTFMSFEFLDRERDRDRRFFVL